MSSKKIPVTFTVDENTVQKLKEEADREHRSKSGMVVEILRQHYEAVGKGEHNG